MPDFHDTRQGRVFYEHTLPALVRALERLAAAVERFADAERSRDLDPVRPQPPPEDLPCAACGAHPPSIPRALSFGGDGLRHDGHCARCGSAGGPKGVHLDPESGEPQDHLRTVFFVPGTDEPGPAAPNLEESLRRSLGRDHGAALNLYLRWAAARLEDETQLPEHKDPRP